MTFQEKSAWIMCFALLVSGAYYGILVFNAAQSLGAMPPPNGVGMGVAVIIIVAIAIFGHAVAAIGNLADAREPEDERDRSVVQRAGNLSGVLLGALCMLSICAYAFMQSGNMLFHLIIAAMVISQFAEYALTIWFYRRGA